VTAPALRIAIRSRTGLTGSLLRSVLRDAGGLVVCETEHIDRLPALVAAEQPDVVVLEWAGASAALVGLVEDLAARGVPVLVLCREVDPAAVLAAMAAGASGFLSLEMGAGELLSALDAVRRWETPLHPRAAATLVEQWREMRRGTSAAGPTADSLSGRELEVLAGMSRGDTSKAVARALGLSLKTVENHKTRIYSKLGVRSQAEAVNVAIGWGLVGGDSGGAGAR
jgi:DNA-binding NarL/FixJ family response regulator